MRKQTVLSTGLPLLLALGLHACATNTEPADDLIYAPDESVAARRCLNLGLVTSTEVVNDWNILFFMRGTDIYRNVLPRRCNGLYREQAFTYRTQLGRLCEGDLVTVLSGIDAGNIAGPACSVGVFYPITGPEVEAIRREAERIREYGIEDELDP